MALVLKDRVKETSTTTGTGTLTLAGAVTGYQSFSSAIGNGNTTYYGIYLDGGSEWEVGLGTVGAGTLARTTVLASSNGGSLVNFSAGQKSVWCDYPATKAVYADASNKLRVDGNPYVDFEDATGTTVAAGRMWYDNTVGSWNLGMGGGQITQQVGEEIFVYGKASAAITEGQLVMKTGVVGSSGTITFAPTTAGLTNDQAIIGIATENIPLNGFGRITAFGVVRGIDTSMFNDGDILWYNPAAGGGAMTATKPTAPNVKCEVGIVINAGSGSSGSIQVEIIHGTELGGTDSNVNISSATGGQLLSYDQVNAYWKNINLTAGTGMTISVTTSGGITITNSDTGSAQNIFKNIAVAGQSTIVADSNNDTLTVAAGTGVTLTTDATTDTLTITTVGIWGA